MKADAHTITWIDAHREPQCTPNPAYPLGLDVDVSFGSETACKVSLPYPAKRCGAFKVECAACGKIVWLTTAGRIDDPRSVNMACNREMVQ